MGNFKFYKKKGPSASKDIQKCSTHALKRSFKHPSIKTRNLRTEPTTRMTNFRYISLLRKTNIYKNSRPCPDPKPAVSEINMPSNKPNNQPKCNNNSMQPIRSSRESPRPREPAGKARSTNPPRSGKV